MIILLVLAVVLAFAAGAALGYRLRLNKLPASFVSDDKSVQIAFHLRDRLVAAEEELKRLRR